MQTKEIIQAFLDSDIDEWTRIDHTADAILPRPCWQSGAHGFSSAWTTFSSYAVLDTNPDIQIVWGLDEDESPFEGREKSPRSFPELPTWPNPEVRMQNAMILWHGMPVHHFFYLVVDGGRGIVPVPDIAAKEPRMGSEYQAFFLRRDFDMVRQLAFIDDRHSTPEYLDQVARALPVVTYRDEVEFGADE